MKRVALTGGIGSGKSTVARVLGMLGVAVYDSDSRARALMESDAELMEAIRCGFGEVYSEGRLDREALAGQVFGDAEALAKLNGLVHPAVERDFRRWAAEQGGEFVVLESAIVFENNLQWGFDAVITVSAPEELRTRRVMERSGLSEADIRARMAVQLTDTEREQRADYIILNDEKHSLREQVLQVAQQIAVSPDKSPEQ